MKQKSTVKLKVIFTCTDLKSSSEDAFELGIQLQDLLKKFKAKSTLDTRQMSIENSNPIPQLAAHLKKLQRKSTRNQKKSR
jgi:hypothetical protein